MDRKRWISVGKILILAIFCALAILVCAYEYALTKPAEHKFSLHYMVDFCEDPVEYDLRVIVLAYNRVNSLLKCLQHLNEVELDGDRAVLEIWIDADQHGKVNPLLLQTAKNFVWTQGLTHVHVRTKNYNVALQWIYSWRPKLNTSEMAVIIEDDVDVSKYFYRYMKSMKHLFSRKDVSGICLNDENTQIAHGSNQGKPLVRPKKDIAFLYPVFCTWGYAPNPTIWRAFQDWYHYNVSRLANFNPLFPEIQLQSSWWREFVKNGRTNTMLHEVYFLRFIKEHGLKTLHPNLGAINIGRNTSFSLHRHEQGLHFSGGEAPDFRKRTVQDWHDAFVALPNPLKEYSWNGSERI